MEEFSAGNVGETARNVGRKDRGQAHKHGSLQAFLLSAQNQSSRNEISLFFMASGGWVEVLKLESQPKNPGA